MRPLVGRLGLGLEIIRTGRGLALLMSPVRAAGAAPEHVTRATQLVLRVPGARHVLQGLLICLLPSPCVRRIGAAVDVAHAASMFALAVVVGHERGRLARSSGAIAAGFALAEWTVALPGQPKLGDIRQEGAESRS